MGQTEEQVREIVERRVRRAVAARALRRLRVLVDEIRREETLDRRSRVPALALLAVLAGVVGGLFLWPAAARLLSGLLG